MNLKLKLKRPKANKSVIFTEFTKNGIYYRLYSGKSISTVNWSKKGIVLSGEDNFEFINKYLKMWVREIDKIFTEAELNKERINEEIVRKRETKYIKACYGGEVLTDYVLGIYKHWFEESAKTTSLEIYNVS